MLKRPFGLAFVFIKSLCGDSAHAPLGNGQVWPLYSRGCSSSIVVTQSLCTKSGTPIPASLGGQPIPRPPGPAKEAKVWPLSLFFDEETHIRCHLPFLLGPWAHTTPSNLPSRFWTPVRGVQSSIAFSIRWTTFIWPPRPSKLATGTPRIRRGKKKSTLPGFPATKLRSDVVGAPELTARPAARRDGSGREARPLGAGRAPGWEHRCPAVPQQPSAIPFREIVRRGLWKCRSLLSYSAFSGQRRDNFPPFRGNVAHDIHLENSVNLHFICWYPTNPLVWLKLVPWTSFCWTYWLHADSYCKFLQGGDR